MARSKGILYSILWICLIICLFITVFHYMKDGTAEPFSFNRLLSSISSETIPDSVKDYEIPTDWLDWSGLDLGEWVIETDLFTLNFNFIRNIFQTAIECINALLYLAVGVVNLIPFISWVLGFIV